MICSNRYAVMTFASVAFLCELVPDSPRGFEAGSDPVDLNRCGPHSLQVCAAYLDAPVRHRDLKKLLSDGGVTTFEQLARTAERIGLTATPVRWSGGLFVPPGAPAILAVELKGRPHFVAAVMRRGNRVLVIDLPDAGWVSTQRLRNEWHWRGEALHIARGKVPVAGLYGLLYLKQLLFAILVPLSIAPFLLWRRRHTRNATVTTGSLRNIPLLLVLACTGCLCFVGGCSETEEGPFRSHYLYRERGTVLFSHSAHTLPAGG